MKIRSAFLIATLAASPAFSQSTADIPSTDTKLQRALEDAITGLGLRHALEQKRLAVSLMDVTDGTATRYAGVNDRQMMYAASLPKIAIVLAGFEAVRAGLLEYTPSVKEMFTRLIRFSSNVDASRAIHAVGFDFIAKVLTSPAYKLYDFSTNGGLWIGKAYGEWLAGAPREYWKGDPVANLSHGANSLQVARYFWLLDQNKLVSPEFSAEMKNIFANPGIHHKFVKGLEALGVSGNAILRKSGSWRDSHCDAALVEHDGKRYIAVALMKDEKGGEVLPKLIQKMDAIIVRPVAATSSTPSGAGLD